ncbi:outer membrane biogenesis protein BamB [Planctomycetes bacterium MalM25]|nr:outer membrane biogenesis protein BamB [Planctomycetes bacterium MalM25]
MHYAWLIVALAVCSVSQGVEPNANDWPQWRGPSRDGHAVGEQWPDSLGEERLVQQWRLELGPSYSGPIVVGDRVLTTETRDKSTEVASAYDRRTGDKLWEREWPGAMKVPFFAATNGSWIRATPACDGETLYVVGMRDVLVALDVATGDERWRMDFPKDHGTELPKFGGASSPMLSGDYLYAQAGNGFAKIDKRTGELAWTVAPDGGGMSGGAFSSPAFTDQNGAQVALVQTRLELKGVDPNSGEEFWSQPIEAFRGMNILTPISYQGHYFTSAHTGRSQLWKQAGKRLEEVWSNKSQAYMSSPVIVGDHLYLHLRNQRIQCLDLRTGQEAWRTRPYGKYQSSVVVGDRILALDERGELLLYNASPEKFELIDSRQVSDDECWAHLAVCGGQVIVRELNALTAYRWE